MSTALDVSIDPPQTRPLAALEFNPKEWAAAMYLAGKIAGEQGIGTGWAHLRTMQAWNYTPLLNSAAAQSIGAGAAVALAGVYIAVNFVGNLTITGFADVAGTAAPIVLTTPTAGWVARLQGDSGDGLLCLNGLSMTCATGADGPNCWVKWRPVDPV